MAGSSHMVRKSYFVDPKIMSQVAKLMGVKSEAEALRKMAHEFLQQERFWRWMKKSAGSAKKGWFKP